MLTKLSKITEREQQYHDDSFEKEYLCSPNSNQVRKIISEFT